MFKFVCYFPAEHPLLLFINIESDAWVTDLSRAILVKLRSRGREVRSRNDLRLFKTDVPLDPREDLQSRALQWLHQQPANGHLEVIELLASFFPNGPRLSDDRRLDIIIANAEVFELVKDLDDPEGPYRRKVKKALDERLNRLLLIPSPLDIVHSPEKLADLLGGDEPLIHLGRPGGAPAALFNPALAILQQNLEHLEQVQVCRADVVRAAEYVRCAVAFYDDDDEGRRQRAIKELIDRAIGEKGEWRFAVGWADNIEPGGGWWYDAFLTLVLELKNTVGLAGDALLQAVIDYSKVVPREKYKHFREYCNFPVVLVGATANRLEISVAVCVGPIYVSKLLALDLSLGFHASNNIVRVARVFKALSLCRTDLQNYYDGVSNLASPKLSCLYPCPTPVDSSRALPKLAYRQFLSRAGQPTSAIVDLGNTTSAMYIATLSETGQEVIVKFTARYNEAAHRLLAEAQLAPRLHFCQRVIGDLYMVVMDRVDGKSIWQLQEDKTPLPAIILKMVEDAVRLLHEHDIVFGDLHDPNILYVESEGRVVLVDFDWAGKDGESRYPATLNPDNGWAEEVSPYSIMHKAHDLWQLERLTALCKGCPK
ncbi:hypothetical protein BDZ97DRAFT_1156495 [Flammula alnicola]|nr:hypothetical protein BDZ97DRAFT_1156495 [Flammula alnicola]